MSDKEMATTTLAETDNYMIWKADEPDGEVGAGGRETVRSGHAPLLASRRPPRWGQIPEWADERRWKIWCARTARRCGLRGP